MWQKGTRLLRKQLTFRDILVVPRGKSSANQKHFPDPGSDTSSVCSGGRRELSAFFSSLQESDFRMTLK